MYIISHIEGYFINTWRKPEIVWQYIISGTFYGETGYKGGHDSVYISLANFHHHSHW